MLTKTNGAQRTVRALIATSLGIVVAFGVITALHKAPSSLALNSSSRPAPASPSILGASGASSPAVSIGQRPASLVVLGDSVASATACNCAGFGSIVASDQSATLTNVAKPGLTTAGLLSQLNSASLDKALNSATVVTVTIGANDFDENLASNPSCSDLSCYTNTLNTLTTLAQSLVSRLTSLTQPGTTIVLTGYWNVFLDGEVGAQHGTIYQSTSDALTREVNAVIKSAATVGHATYTDIYTPFKGDGDKDDTKLLAPDGDHPNAAGHAVIASAIERSIVLASPS